MLQVDWSRFLVVGTGATLLAVPVGLDAVGVVFFVVALAAIASIVRAARTNRPRSQVVWYLLALALSLFVVGGIADSLAPNQVTTGVLDYPGWREPFDLVAYVTAIVAVALMARARRASRDRTITLDALVTVGGVGLMAWATVMSSYLRSGRLSPLGQATGIAFTLAALMLAFMVVRVAIGPGARPPAYRLLSAAAAGAFGAEIFIELELSGRLHIANSELLSTTISCLAVVCLGASALHPTMSELTEPPLDATPRMTWRRFAAMAAAVLLPAVLLASGLVVGGSLDAIGVGVVWAVLSVMVMIRIYALARVRERLAEMDRTLASAAAEVAAAADRDEMVEAALRAVGGLVPGLDGVSVHWWRSGGWHLVGGQGQRVPLPAAAEPHPSLGEEITTTADGVLVDLQFEAGPFARGVLTLAAPACPNSFELTRLGLLVSDLSRALESTALREQLVRERSERRFRSLVEHSDDVIMVVDATRRIRFVSPAGPRLLGRSEESLVGAALADLAADGHRSTLETVLTRPGGPPTELQLATSDDGARWFDVSSADMTDEPEIGGIVVTAREITARKQAKIDLERSEARFRSLVQHASDLVAVLDGSGILSWVSPSSQRLLGHTPAAMVERSVLDLVHPFDRPDLSDWLDAVSFNRSLARDHGEVRFEHSDGGWRVLEVTFTDLITDPCVGGIVLNAHDVTERKALEQSLRHQALHDDLTGLANRVKLRRAIDAARARVGNLFAVLMLDIDDFKTINDGLGHSTGDEILTEVGRDLAAVVRPTDLVARLGGDEFAVLVEGVENREQVLALAVRLQEAVETPRQSNGRQIVLHASTGVAFSADVSPPMAEVMVSSADLAMYRAKGKGKAQVAVFDQSMLDGVFERLELKADLVRALEQGELLVHYQPVTDLARGSIVGFEALMRWRHPDRGMVGPGTFIPLAEETGLIVPIGRWLIGVALTQLRTWQRAFPATPPLVMAVNVSGRQLEDPGIVNDIRTAIATAGIDPSTVVVELTESIVVEDSPALVQRLHDIRALGVGLHADDFGSGFASYASLQSLPFTGVKIDRSLIDGLHGTTADRARAQVRSIIEMSASTGMKVVAEGIESGEQAELLRALACNHGQGYFFARPADASAVTGLLRQRAGRS